MTTRTHDGNITEIPNSQLYPNSRLVIDNPSCQPVRYETWNWRADIITHAHADHMGDRKTGMRKKWRERKVYCSKMTSRLIRAKFRGPPASWFITPELDTVFDIVLSPCGDVGSQVNPTNCDPDDMVENKAEIKAVFLDAHHIDGSVMVLISHDNKLVFHSGDFRWDDSMMEKIRRAKQLLGFERDAPVANMYLDATFFHPGLNFNKRKTSFRLFKEKLEEMERTGEFNPMKSKIYVRSGSLGPDWLLGKLLQYWEQERKCKWKIYFVSKSGWKQRVFLDYLRILPLTANYVADKEEEATIIALDYRKKHDASAWHEYYFSRTDGKKGSGNVFLWPSVLGYIINKDTTLGLSEKMRREYPKDIHKSLDRAPENFIGIWHLLYSSHSNFIETQNLVEYIRPKNVVPIGGPVNRKDDSFEGLRSTNHCAMHLSKFMYKEPEKSLRDRGASRKRSRAGSYQSTRPSKKHVNAKSKGWRKWPVHVGGVGITDIKKKWGERYRVVKHPKNGGCRSRSGDMGSSIVLDAVKQRSINITDNSSTFFHIERGESIDIQAAVNTTEVRSPVLKIVNAESDEFHTEDHDPQVSLNFEIVKIETNIPSIPTPKLEIVKIATSILPVSALNQSCVSFDKYWNCEPDLSVYRTVLKKRWRRSGWILGHFEKWCAVDVIRLKRIVDALEVKVVRKCKDARWIVLPMNCPTVSKVPIRKYVEHFQRKLIKLRWAADNKRRWIVSTNLLQYIYNRVRSDEELLEEEFPLPVWENGDLSQEFAEELFGRQHNQTNVSTEEFELSNLPRQDLEQRYSFAGEEKEEVAIALKIQKDV